MLKKSMKKRVYRPIYIPRIAGQLFLLYWVIGFLTLLYIGIISEMIIDFEEFLYSWRDDWYGFAKVLFLILLHASIPLYILFQFRRSNIILRQSDVYIRKDYYYKFFHKRYQEETSVAYQDINSIRIISTIYKPDKYTNNNKLNKYLILTSYDGVDHYFRIEHFTDGQIKKIINDIKRRMQECSNPVEISDADKIMANSTRTNNTF